MSEIASLSLEINSDSAVTMRERQDEATASGARLEHQTKRISSESQVFQNIANKTGESLDQVRARYGTAANEAKNLTDQVQRQVQVNALATDSVNTYGMSAEQATLRIIALQSAMKEFNKEGNQAVEALKKVGGVGDEAGRALGGATGHTKAFYTSIMALGREVMQGDFSNVPPILLRIAQHAGLLTAATVVLVGPWLALAAAIGGFVYASIKGHQEMVEMNNAIQKTGNFAGTTTDQMRDLSTGMAEMGTITVGTAKEIVTQLVGSGQIYAGALQKVAELAENFAATTGQNIDKIAPELVKLFADPAKGAEELNKTLHFLNAAELEHIGHLVRIGQEGQAQVELAEKLNPHLSKNVENLGSLESAAKQTMQAFSSMWDAAMAVGRDVTQKMQLFAQQAKLTALEQTKANLVAQGITDGPIKMKDLDAEIDRQTKAVLAMNQKVLAEEALAKAAGKTAEVHNEGLRITKLAESSTGARIRMMNEQVLAAENLLKLTNEEAGITGSQRKEIEQSILDTKKKVLSTQMSIGADARAIANQTGAQETALFAIQIKRQTDQQAFLLKSGQINKEEHDARVNELKMQMLVQRETIEQEILDRGGLSVIKRKDHEATLIQIQAQKDALEEGGANQLKLDALAKEAELRKMILASTLPLITALSRMNQVEKDFSALIVDQVNHLRLENELLGLTALQIEKVTIARKIDAEVAKAVHKASAEEGDFNSQMQNERIERIYAAAEAGKVQIGVILDTAEALKIQKSVMDSLAGTMADFFADLITNGKSAFDRLTDMLKQFLAEMIAVFVKRWFLNMAAGGSILGSAGQALAGGVGAGGTASNVMSWASSGYSAYQSGAGFSGFFGGAPATAGAGWGTSSTGLATLGSEGVAGGGAGAGAGGGALVTVAWIAAVVAAMYANNELYTRGWRRPEDSTTRNPLTAIGSAPRGAEASYSADAIFRSLGFSPRMASLFSGSSLNTRLFGHGRVNEDAAGITGTVTGGGGFDAAAWQDYSRQGGTFRSDIRWRGGPGGEDDPVALTSTQEKPFQDAITLIHNQMIALGEMLGVDAAELLKNYSREFTLQLTSTAGQEEIDQAIADFLNAVFVDQTTIVLAAATGQMRKYIDDFVGTTEELIEALAAVSAIFNVSGRSPMADALEMLANEADPFNFALRSNAEAMRFVMDAYDGSLIATQDLANATIEYYNSQVQLIAVIGRVKQAIDEMFDATFRSIEMSGKTKQQQYDFLQEEARMLRDRALASTDPAEIQALATRINQNIMQAWGLLDTGQQDALRSQFLTLGRATQEEIGAHLLTIQSGIAATTTNLLSEIRNLIGAGAETQVTAANTQLAAANINSAPRTINVVVTNNSGASVVNDSG